jgi:hypothetical protein
VFSPHKKILISSLQEEGKVIVGIFHPITKEEMVYLTIHTNRVTSRVE